MYRAYCGLVGCGWISDQFRDDEAEAFDDLDGHMTEEHGDIVGGVEHAPEPDDSE